MGLRGTLKDFGIADIFQLVGHQGKTGSLTVKSRDISVRIFFRDGNVVRAEPDSRQKRDLIGNMLVRAEIITKRELDHALTTHRSTGKRLGESLVDLGYVDDDALLEFAKLQTTETLYRLFLWDSGTYEFEAEEGEPERDVTSVRSERVLMEGFRQVDEWANIRKLITGYGMTFSKLEDLDALLTQDKEESAGEESDDPFGDLDDAFGEFDLGGGGGGSQRLRNIAEPERMVYTLINEKRDVQKLIDLARLGEFETCQAIVNLLSADIIEPVSETPRKPSATAPIGGITSARVSRRRRVFRAVAIFVVLVGAWVALQLSGVRASGWLRGSSDVGFQPQLIQSWVSPTEELRLKRALEVYRASTGHYPEALAELAEVGLVETEALGYPWHGQFHYQRSETGYTLVRPFH